MVQHNGWSILEIYKFLLPTRYLVEVLSYFGCKGPYHLQLMYKNHMAYFRVKILRAFQTNFSVLVFQYLESVLKIHQSRVHVVDVISQLHTLFGSSLYEQFLHGGLLQIQIQKSKENISKIRRNSWFSSRTLSRVCSIIWKSS